MCPSWETVQPGEWGRDCECDGVTVTVGKGGGERRDSAEKGGVVGDSVTAGDKGGWRGRSVKC